MRTKNTNEKKQDYDKLKKTKIDRATMLKVVKDFNSNIDNLEEESPLRFCQLSHTLSYRIPFEVYETN